MHQSDSNVRIGSKVRLISDGVNVSVGKELLGRVLDAMGNPLDNKKSLITRNGHYMVKLLILYKEKK